MTTGSRQPMTGMTVPRAVLSMSFQAAGSFGTRGDAETETGTRGRWPSGRAQLPTVLGRVSNPCWRDITHQGERAGGAGHPSGAVVHRSLAVSHKCHPQLQTQRKAKQRPLKDVCGAVHSL